MAVHGFPVVGPVGPRDLSRLGSETGWTSPRPGKNVVLVGGRPLSLGCRSGLSADHEGSGGRIPAR